jgi:uncharacterized membrane protein
VVGRAEPTRLIYLDWLRGVAVVAMVLSHVTDSWTHPDDRRAMPFYTLTFIAGVASSLFLFLAGVTCALSAGAHARRSGDHRAGAALARRRGWQIFGLALLFRVQSLLLGLAPLESLLKVDMLNVMGLSMVMASYVWGVSADRRRRLAALALVTGAVAMVTPLVRQATWLAGIPDPLEAYLRPAGGFAAFPLFAWAGFLFAGVIAGDLIDAVRAQPQRVVTLQNGLVLSAGAGFLLAWWASYQPSIYEAARFWSDSPTFFFIRLSLVVLLLPISWLAEQLLPRATLKPLVTFGRSSLFVYWIHVEMVYGVVANPLKRQLPLPGALCATGALVVLVYGAVLLKNRLMQRHELRGPWRILEPVLR